MTTIPALDARSSEAATAGQKAIPEENSSSVSSGSRGRHIWLNSGLLALLTAFMVYLCWQMIVPFIPALTWALALVIAAQPLRSKLIGRMRPTMVSLLTIAVILFAVGIPALLLSQQIIQESVRGQYVLREMIRQDFLSKSLLKYPWLSALWNWTALQVDLSEAVHQVATTVGGTVGPLFAGSFRAVSELLTSIFILFFFLRDQETILRSVSRLLPLKPIEIDQIFKSISLAIYAAVYGRLVIGFLQGFLGGLVFWFVGLPAPVFWGSLMAVLSILPVVGAFIVWAPAAVFLLMTGAWGQALGVVLWGVLVIHPVDNILYPILVGERLGLHALVLFVAFLGGLIIFGPPGLILGPAIIAGALGLIAVWQSDLTHLDSEGASGQ